MKPSQIHSHSIDIVSGVHLRPGDVVSVRVLESLPAGRYRLQWNTQRITAESALTFTHGQVLRGVVENSAGSLRIRLLSHVNSTVLPQDSHNISSQTLLSGALLRAGSGLPESMEFKRRSTLLARARGHKFRLARVYAELLNRNADPTADFLENMDSLLSGKNPRDPKRRLPWSSVPTAHAIAEEVNAETVQDAVLNLFAAVQGTHGTWSFRRLFRRLHNRDINIVIKYRRSHSPALALTIHDSQGTMEFLLEGKNPIRMAVYSDKQNHFDKKIWLAFCERLAIKNVIVENTIYPISESDGFTTGAKETFQKAGDKFEAL